MLRTLLRVSGACKLAQKNKTKFILTKVKVFLLGFFGIPAEDQYNLEVTIEWSGFNNTLAPYSTVRLLQSVLSSPDSED